MLVDLEFDLEKALQTIHCHREFNNTSCPGEKFELESFKAVIRETAKEHKFDLFKLIPEYLVVQPTSRVWEEIVIHHSACDDTILSDWESIWAYHLKDRGWGAIGYHFGIEKVKDLYVIRQGRSLDKDGVHCRGHNSKAVGIVFVGNFSKYSPTLEQLRLGAKLCLMLFSLGIVK